MTIKRMTKTDVPRSFGAFKPVGHVVIAFDNDEQATQAAEALRASGFKDEDILQYSAVEEAEQMKELLGHASGFAEFGHEVALMRKYRELASEGCGWLIVYAPEHADAERVAEVARRFNARLAEKYHRLVIEDLL